jgi:Zn-dependent peptidase ImmA (M78 family)
VTQDPEEAARASRDRFGLGPKGPIPDLLELVESVAGIPVIVAQLGNEGIAGAYMIRRDEPFILVNGSNQLVRGRFTLAHEFGHHSLGHGQVLDARIQYSLSGDPREISANRFAAELLLPREGVEWWFERHRDPRPTLETVVRIAHDFGVSAQVARYRLEAARKLSQRDGPELDLQIADGAHRELASRLALPRRMEGLTDARQRPVRLPARTEAILLQAMSTGLMTTDQVARRLGRTANEVKAMARSAAENAD